MSTSGSRSGPAGCAGTRKNAMIEYWELEATVRCHDVLWVNAERGDIRALEKKDAMVLLNRNPGKFKRVGIHSFDGSEWNTLPRDYERSD
jgi:hypothetical protein